jgi:septum formation protein
LKLTLASSSPRRREFLKQLRIPFKIVEPCIEEVPNARETPAHFARRAAGDKAQAVARLLKATATEPEWLVIAADTIVVLGKRILGKPKSAADARRMLLLLSGLRHQVISGLCVMSQAKSKSLVVSTDVEFKKLTREEIEFYVASGEPMDKAGAYAIQGIGSFMIRAIRGSYTNVVGLPVAELLDILENDFGLKLPYQQYARNIVPELMTQHTKEARRVAETPRDFTGGGFLD